MLLGALTIASVIFGLLEPAMPVWMISTMEVEDWQLGKNVIHINPIF